MIGVSPKAAPNPAIRTSTKPRRKRGLSICPHWSSQGIVRPRLTLSPWRPPAICDMYSSAGGFQPPVTSRRTATGFGRPPNMCLIMMAIDQPSTDSFGARKAYAYGTSVAPRSPEHRRVLREHSRTMETWSVGCPPGSELVLAFIGQARPTVEYPTALGRRTSDAPAGPFALEAYRAACLNSLRYICRLGQQGLNRWLLRIRRCFHRPNTPWTSLETSSMKPVGSLSWRPKDSQIFSGHRLV